MTYQPKFAKLVALGLGAALAWTPALAQHDHGGNGGRGAPAHAEQERAPMGYQRVQQPQGWNQRPQTVDRNAYRHNFVANQGYHIGPYRAPRGFVYRRWAYGQFLPRAFWIQDYWLSDYWLFGLDVPPYGFEWVRYGPDALLIDTRTGEVMQVIYGRFN